MVDRENSSRPVTKKISSARLVIDLSWAIDLESVIRRRLTRAGADDACGMQGCRNLLDPEERAAQAWWGAADGWQEFSLRRAQGSTALD